VLLRGVRSVATPWDLLAKLQLMQLLSLCRQEDLDINKDSLFFRSQGLPKQPEALLDRDNARGKMQTRV